MKQHLRFYPLALCVFLMLISSLSSIAQKPSKFQSAPGDLIQVFDSAHGYTWDTLAGNWLFDYKYNSFLYDAHGNLLRDVRQNKSSGLWVNATQELYTYDAWNHLAEFTTQSWSGGTWVNQYRDLFTYDNDGNQTS